MSEQPHWQPIREQDIVNPIDPSLPPDTKADQLCALSVKNKPIIDKFLAKIADKYSIESASNLKLKERILNKASRPAIRELKPWFNVEHVRDALRFRTALEDINDLPKILADLKAEGIVIVKAETAKMLKPRAWGWRAVMYDLKLPDGQLVEYYLSPKEMIQANDQVHHPLYETWRERDTKQLSEEETLLYQQSIEVSNAAFKAAWEHYLERTCQSNETVKAVLAEADCLTNS